MGDPGVASLALTGNSPSDAANAPESSRDCQIRTDFVASTAPYTTVVENCSINGNLTIKSQFIEKLKVENGKLKFNKISVCCSVCIFDF